MSSLGEGVCWDVLEPTTRGDFKNRTQAGHRGMGIMASWFLSGTHPKSPGEEVLDTGVS
jgi:hypothetical protein